MGKELQKAIVLGGDNGYMDKIETTIKSICAHNRAVTFYIFNDDLPSEWFQLMERRLEPLASKIVNVKISHQGLKGYSLPLAHLSYATFFRYFIPQYVSEDLALYLDSDIIVRSNLDELFLEDMADCPVAAVADALVPSTFNVGVLLINVALWRQEKVTEHLLSLTDQLHDQVFGDQGILNHLFEGRWKPLPATYNFMVGMDTVARNYQMDSWYSDSLAIEKTAKIIHYTGDKPWYQINLNRFREDWWFYYGLEWSDIVMKKCDFHKGLASLVQAPQYATAIFTNTCHIEQIEHLIQELPDVEFSILAHTNFAPEIMNLQSHLNVRLYPYFNPMNVKKVLEKIDFYLDINHEDEIANIIQEVQQREIPVFAFETTSHDPSGCSQVYSPTAVDEMIESIRTLLESKKQSL